MEPKQPISPDQTAQAETPPSVLPPEPEKKNITLVQVVAFVIALLVLTGISYIAATRYGGPPADTVQTEMTVPETQDMESTNASALSSPLSESDETEAIEADLEMTQLDAEDTLEDINADLNAL